MYVLTLYQTLFIHHSFITLWSSACYALGTILSARNTAVNNTGNNLCSQGAPLLKGDVK